MDSAEARVTQAGHLPTGLAAPATSGEAQQRRPVQLRVTAHRSVHKQ